MEGFALCVCDQRSFDIAHLGVKSSSVNAVLRARRAALLMANKAPVVLSSTGSLPL